ncbi:MAG: indolepyruvate ferredoxin oxidoreductase family protein [Gammaproteobacteria bacterium]|nr:indolepyruvate ferredoxin oxidoreductase family protein [Gammaproteobacteria bacterium]
MQLDDYRLEDRYLRDSGRVFLTGTQALVRLPLLQRALDRQAGLNTAGFISGYRGSPLGSYDLELWRAGQLLAENEIEFLPAVNEDLAATAVLGSQQVETDPYRKVDGVFSIWYGKGPGVDRSGDALKHGNAYGSSPHGGVLVVAGDDHGAVSSSMPHQSDVAFLTFFMPHLNPANVEEYLSFGLYGFALSRFSGCWVGFKAISETVESAMSLSLPQDVRFEIPDDFTAPPGGLHYRWPDLPGPQIEERLEAKKEAAMAFARANPIDRRVFDVPDARYGIVTTGKGHLDLMEALRLLDIDRAEAKRIGLDVYKVGMVWPLEQNGALDFVRQQEEVLVVEEKRGIIESWFKEAFYDHPGHKPQRMVGKQDELGRKLIPWVGELSPLQLAPIVARRIDAVLPGLNLTERADALAREPLEVIKIAGANRMPYFCSGCPHNTSTKVPEGSQALAGIGCHFMASWMDRDTESLIQMGGEGVNWVAKSKFNGGRHIFQNLGEGTLYHSGSLAIRQAVAANTNITFKILYNDAVAMTGGQPIDGPISVQAIAHSIRAEGVERIALLSDNPDKFSARSFPRGVTIDHRRELDRVQRELREIDGVTVLIYEQACATETRRKRKRGLAPEVKRHVVINDLVCEGCGDCSVESNCLSVVPKETAFGRKRQIDQNSCNKDFSCINGFCPSFVTVEGGRRRRPAPAGHDIADRVAALPLPQQPDLAEPYDLLVTGVGGTGVITVGAMIAMAAHLEGKGASVLDFMGFAQKFGTVLCFLRIADDPAKLNQVRIVRGRADALLGCDLVVSSSPRASVAYSKKVTRAVMNTAEMATADFVLDRDASLRADDRVDAVRAAVKELATVPANRLAGKLLGDTIYANVLTLGMAWQKGLVPVSLDAMHRAIELNGVKVETNLAAFNWGRLVAADPEFVAGLIPPAQDFAAETLMQVVQRRADFLVDYQDKRLADKYTALVDRVRNAEQELVAGSDVLSEAVARSYFKLLAYKDEYEVGRLHTRTGFAEQVAQQFEGDYKLNYHMAPPLLSPGVDARGRPRKRAFGPWLTPLLGMLARMKGLRGTPLDLFGYTAERRLERALIVEFEQLVERLLAGLTTEKLAAAAAIAAMPMEIRGFGPVKIDAAKKVREQLAAAVDEYEKPASRPAETAAEASEVV